jgi:hypothetical protein
MLLRYLFLNLFGIFILIFTFAAITAFVSLFTRLPALEYLLMLFIHLLHFLLLVLSSNLLTATLDILYICCNFCVIPHLSQLAAMVFFCHELALLIFVKPRDGFDIDVELLESSDVFSEDFFDSGDPKEEKRVSNHANIYILELKNILEVMLHIRSDVGDECSFSLFDIVSITRHNLIQLFSQRLNAGFLVDKLVLGNLCNSYTFIPKISNEGLLMRLYQ